MSMPIILPKLSGSALKVIAILSMVIDHCACFLMNESTMAYEVMRCVGRIAFPVFAFLIAEGFAHTRNRNRYFGLLLGFAIVSEIPWYLLNGADGTHNVMFTLALGVVALASFEILKKDGTLCICTILLIAWFATWSGVDYEWRGVLMIVIFYLFDKNTSLSGRMTQLLCAFPLMMHYGIIGAMHACIVIFFYDGTRGFIRGSMAKYGVYAFYPMHLLVIYAYQLL
ncbi:TraX family protein [Bacteroides sp. KG68]|uniref:TraX family protein n=1 Tax=unclassified Bacteroides TaxID=2646097 RepID=UPI003D985A5D